jgi:hypothetical protein
MDGTGRFELRGADGDETRLVVHDELGYAIAVPGRPHLGVAAPGSPRYDVVLAMQDAPVEVGLRMDEVPTQIRAPALVAALLTSYATTRAANLARLRPDALDAPLLPRGAACGMGASYGLRGDDDAAMESLAIIARTTRADLVHALFLTVRFRAGDFTPFSWSNLRPALLAHQSFTPGELPSTAVWPPHPAFAMPKAKLELTDAAFAVAQAKAAQIGQMTPQEVGQIADVLLNATHRDLPPSAAWDHAADLPLARAIAGCIPTVAAEVLLRNQHEVQTAHDFRGWLWQCFWAVGNRASLRRR